MAQSTDSPNEPKEPTDTAPDDGSGGTDGSQASAGGSSAPATPTIQEIADAMGKSVDDPEVTSTFGGIKFRAEMEAAARDRAAREATAREQEAAAEAQRQAAEAEAKKIVVDYDDPFTGEHVHTTVDPAPEFSNPMAAAEARTMIETQQLIKDGVTTARLQTEGYSTTNTVDIGGKRATTTHIARPDGRLETVTTIVDGDGDGTRTTTVRNGLTGDGLLMIEEPLDNGRPTGRRTIAEQPGPDGTVPTPGPNAPPPPNTDPVTQQEADDFVDAIKPGGPTTPGGKALLGQVASRFGFDPSMPGADQPGTGQQPGVGGTGTGTFGGRQPGSGTGGTTSNPETPPSSGGRQADDPRPGGFRPDDTGDTGGGAPAGNDPVPGAGAGGPATNPPADNTGTPDWQGALDNLGKDQTESEPTGINGMAPRGDGGSTDTSGLGIGPLNAEAPPADRTSGRTSTTKDTTKNDAPPSEPAPASPPPTNVIHIRTIGGEPLADVVPLAPSASADDETNPNAGTTDDDDAGDYPDDSGDDTGDDTGDATGTGDDGATATAYVNLDVADTLGVGAGAFRVVPIGGGFTDGGRDDLPVIDLTGVEPESPRDRSPFAHISPDADDGAAGFLRPVVLGGGFTDGGRADLPVIDLTGITPEGPRSGNDAFGRPDDGGDGAFVAHAFHPIAFDTGMQLGDGIDTGAFTAASFDDQSLASPDSGPDAGVDPGTDPGADQQGFGGDGPLPFP